MKFPPSFLQEIRERVPVLDVVSRKVKLQKKGREYVGLSPFNAEKTPSFFVNEQKHRWFDFSAGKDGDVFAFLMEIEGLSFHEAVEQLAGQAGLSMPEADPVAEAREQRRVELIEVVEIAQAFFVKCLSRSPQAMEYLTKRGVTEDDVRNFGIGLAGLPSGGRTQLREHLAAKGVSIEQGVEAGLLGEGDATTYDRFRQRITLPIADWRGRVVGFGARATSPEDKPKYLNSPETILFSKGVLLYNGARARKAVHEEKRELIVVEGYFDVIAAERAGYAAVSAMGTSLTEHHIRALWKITPSPIICMDGDGAGRRAARRIITKSFPEMRPGRTLRFVDAPRGEDPDSIVRRGGAGDLRRMVDRSVDMEDALWGSVYSGQVTATDLADLEERVVGELAAIPIWQLRQKFVSRFRDRLRSVSRRRRETADAVNAGAIYLTGGWSPPQITLNDASILVAAVSFPDVLLSVAEEMEMTMSGRTRDIIAQIIELIDELPEADAAAVTAGLRDRGVAADVEEAYRVCHNAGITSLDPEGDPEAARSILTRH